MNIKNISNKIMISVLLVILCVIMSDINTTINVSAVSNSTSEVVMEVNSNRVLYEKNSKDKKFMASTTKILTAIVVIENIDVNTEITVKKDTIGIEGSSIYLEEGEKLKVIDLLYGLMLRSGNDCAETLAVSVFGSIEKCANVMNSLAKKIGAKDSNFVNPHGLHDDNHYTTAYDLGLISCYAMKNSIFREIVGTKTKKIPFSTRDYDRILINKNKMLKEFEGSNGIKTGYTKKAGRCLVSSCVRNGLELVCVVLNCPPMFERSKTLLNQCFSEYKLYKIISKQEIIGFIPIGNSDKKCPVIINEDVNLPLTESEYNSLNVEVDLPKMINKPFDSGKEIGSIKIFSQNNLIFTQKIYTIVSIK